MNDLHAAYNPDSDGKSKFSRIKGYYHSVRNENPFTVFTNGGDNYEKGSIAEQYSHGLATRLIIERMGFDVRVIGNHDLAWSIDEAVAYSRIPKQIAISSNMTWSGNSVETWGAVTWSTLTVGCVKIGFFGFTSQPWNEKHQMYEGDYYSELKARYDYIVLARQFVETHRKDVDMIVMLSHIGKKEDESVARAVPGIDIILGAHSHTVIQSKRIVNGALIAQAGSNGNFVDRIDVTIDLTSRRIVHTDYAVLETSILEVDEEMEDFIEKVLMLYAPDWHTTIAHVGKRSDNAVIAGIAAKAATKILNTKAGIVEVSTVSEIWQSGDIIPQQLFDTFPVQRQKSGTLGFNGMTTVTISGNDLLVLIHMIDSQKWKLYIEGGIDSRENYTIAFQKRGAYSVDSYFPGIKVSNIIEKKELWDILILWSKKQTTECRYLDSEKKMAWCPDSSKRVEK